MVKKIQEDFHVYSVLNEKLRKVVLQKVIIIFYELDR